MYVLLLLLLKMLTYFTLYSRPEAHSRLTHLPFLWPMHSSWYNNEYVCILCITFVAVHSCGQQLFFHFFLIFFFNMHVLELACATLKLFSQTDLVEWVQYRSADVFRISKGFSQPDQGFFSTREVNLLVALWRCAEAIYCHEQNHRAKPQSTPYGNNNSLQEYLCYILPVRMLF